MDFFAQQDRARRQTRFLIFMFVLALIAIVIAVDAVVLSTQHTEDIAWDVLKEAEMDDIILPVIKLDYALIPAWSDITIDSIPTGTTVLIDGIPAGSTPQTLELLEGEHEIELKADRFQPWQTRLVVKANQPQVLDTVQLQPADGKLTVRTRPAGANVMLENTFAGQTPVELNLTADEPHSIHISKAGYS